MTGTALRFARVLFNSFQNAVYRRYKNTQHFLKKGGYCAVLYNHFVMFTRLLSGSFSSIRVHSAICSGWWPHHYPAAIKINKQPAIAIFSLRIVYPNIALLGH